MPTAKYHVVVTDDASADLLDIGLYIAEESPAAALRIVGRLRGAAVGSYSIFYHVTDDRVEVLHFLHHARDHEPLVFPED